MDRKISFMDARLLTAALAFLLVGSLASQVHAEPFDHKHAHLTEFTKKFTVTTGAASQVKYAQAKVDRSVLDTYLASVARVSEVEFKIWTDSQKKAFLINSYNAYTIDFILKNYPLKSIKDLGNFLVGPWKKKNFPLFGAKVHLDHIEHDLARGQFQEPRFHFAFNCASIGCPKLLDEAFVADRLEQQLESAAKIFLNDQSRNRVDHTKKIFYLSKIFDWYRKDFEKNAGSLIRYAAKYIEIPATNRTQIDSYKVEFLDYDWNLNDFRP